MVTKNTTAATAIRSNGDIRFGIKVYSDSFNYNKIISFNFYDTHGRIRFDLSIFCNGIQFMYCSLDAYLHFTISLFFCRNGKIHRTSFVERICDPESIVFRQFANLLDNEKEDGHKTNPCCKTNNYQQRLIFYDIVKGNTRPAETEHEVHEISQRK